MFLKKRPAVIAAAVAFALVLPVSAWAQSGSQSQAMTLDQAVQSALQYNNALNSAQYGVNMANNKLISSLSTGNFIVSGIGQQNAYAALNYAKDNAIYTTEEDYFNVQDQVYAVQVAQKSAEEAQLAYNLAQACEQAGVDTATQVATAKSNLDMQQSLLTAAQTKLAGSYVAFDNWVGLNPTETPDLTTQVTYNPSYYIGVANTDQAVADTLQNNYQAIVAKNQLLQTQSTLDSVNPLTNVYNTSQQAQLAEQATFQQLTGEARGAFLMVNSAQDTYDAAVKAYTAAQAAYSDAQAEYNAGMYTKDELLKGELGLLSAGQQLQADLHGLLLAQAELALITGDGSVSISGN